jgi:hypothetical protein
MGLQNRFSENSSTFKKINTTYISGLKEFKGTGLYDNGNIKYNFNGKTETFSVS